MKIGWPAGATASMRADAGGATPTRRLPRRRRPPTDPLTPTSALSVETARHAAVASVSASAASGADVPGPDGSLTSGPAHDAVDSAASRRNSPPPRLTVLRVLGGGEFTSVTMRSFLGEFLFRGADLLVDVAAVDRIAVAAQRARPRRDRFVDTSELEQDIAVMILNHRIG